MFYHFGSILLNLPEITGMDVVDLNKLRTFLAVVDADSISGAARELGLTRSAISQSVSTLERSLGVKLFNRVGRGLVLTAEGRTLSRRFRRQQELLREALDEITNTEEEVRGLIRLGLFVGASRTNLARFVREFLAEHARAQLKLLYGSQRELQQMLVEGRLDFALAIEPSLELRGKLESTLLYRQELVLVSHERVVRGSAAFADVRELPLVDYYQTSPLIERWFRHHFGRHAPRENVRAWAASTDLVLDLILEGAGVGVVPRYLADPLLREKRLFLIRSGKAELQDSIWLEEPACAYLGAGLRAFREALLKSFASST